MGYLSCRADSSVATCRSITAISPLPLSRRSGVGGRRRALPAAVREGDGEASSAAATIERFAYDELEAATSHFADAALLGRGSHGAVYKAVLASGRAVAVKRPSPRRPEVDNEIRILSSVRGPRLVNLLGFSDSGAGADQQQHRPRLLVVEYMPNGTLYELLHSNPRPPGWPRRIRLALQTARALRALHDADPPVIHRDVKSANVLLDANLDARLGDFGLALRVPKRLPGDAAANAAATPAPAGTLGYLDPAYVTPESLSTKTDVFSFGILLLEIMSGRKAIDVQHSPPSVVEWAVPLLRKGKVASLFDPRVAPPRDPVTRRDLAALAASCVRSCRERRPSMADIVDRLVVLSKAVSGKMWNGLAVVGNPCAVVDVQKTIAKRAAAAAAGDRAASQRELTSALAFDDDEKKEEDDAANAGALEEDEVPLVGAKKAPRPLKNGKVFSEPGARERRNLLELMARIDGVAGQRFGITRARTVRSASEPIEKDAAVLLLRRNQTVKVLGSQALSKSDIFSSLDAKIKHELGKEQQEEAGKIKHELVKEQQEKAGNIKQESGEEQEKAGKTKHDAGTGKGHVEKAAGINREAGKEQEKVEKNQEKEMKIQEKLGEIFDKAMKSEEKTGQNPGVEKKIQDTAEKKQEHDARVVQDKVEKIQDEAKKIQ
uniref:Protein kinase domain-containing protein n=1 Tax=Oryza meridionalis TaxID=40149 RepID=A0A0E0DR04_9ORYZ